MSELTTAAMDLIENEPVWKSIRGVGIGDGSKREGTVLNGYETARWTKYGRDLVYFHDADGYVDIETGAVEEGAPITNVEVEQDRGDTWTIYYMEVRDGDYVSEEPVVALRR